MLSAFIHFALSLLMWGMKLKFSSSSLPKNCSFLTGMCFPSRVTNEACSMPHRHVNRTQKVWSPLNLKSFWSTHLVNSQLDLSLANEPISRLEAYQQAVHADRIKSKRRKTFLKLFILSTKICNWEHHGLVHHFFGWTLVTKQCQTSLEMSCE